MIWQLLLKIFIPVSRIIDNEDDILMFSRNFQKSNASEILFKKQNKKKYEMLPVSKYVEK